jgi:hypothetical protein
MNSLDQFAELAIHNFQGNRGEAKGGGVSPVAMVATGLIQIN